MYRSTSHIHVYSKHTQERHRYRAISADTARFTEQLRISKQIPYASLHGMGGEWCEGVLLPGPGWAYDCYCCSERDGEGGTPAAGDMTQQQVHSMTPSGRYALCSCVHPALLLAIFGVLSSLSRFLGVSSMKINTGVRLSVSNNSSLDLLASISISFYPLPVS